MQLLDRSGSPGGDASPQTPVRGGGNGTGRERRSRDSAPALMAGGVGLTLVGMVGDLASHALAATSHAHEELIVLGRGNNPWHLVLFGGILLAAVGAILWASRRGTELASFAGAALILFLTATVAAGTWSGWKAAREQHDQGTVVASGGIVAGHDHSGSVAAVPNGSVALGDQASVGDGAEGGAHFAGHSHGQPGPISDQDELALARILTRVKAATAKYRSIETAKADGFIQVTQFVPGLGLHLAKIDQLNAPFDPLLPNVLLYMPTPSGGLRLAGVAYSVPHVSEQPPQGFPGGLDVWHYHTDLCFLPNGTVTITPDQASCQVRHGLFQAQTSWLLHAWIWVPNPHGVFVEDNPNVF
jgi:hypothetical protein